MKRQTLGRVLIIVGVLMWVPYFILKANGAQVEVAPFLIAHLSGVIPGAILAPSDTLWRRLTRRIERE